MATLPDVMDLTQDEGLSDAEPPAIDDGPEGVDAAHVADGSSDTKKPAGGSASAGYDKDDLLRRDPELSRLREKAVEHRRTVKDLNKALSAARYKLNVVEKAISTRTKRLVEEAESKIDWVGRTFPWDETLQRVLTDTFGIRSFRPLQREALNACLSRRDVFAIMPTGSGKSLIFQLAAMVDGGVTVVVTPLVALMQDQVESLQKLGVSAHRIDASTPQPEITRILNEAIPNELKKVVSARGAKAVSRKQASSSFDVAKWKPRTDRTFLIFVTPERVAKSKRFLSRLELAYEADHLTRFCIDEVHCVSQWGHDFRRDYTQLGVLRRQFSSVPIVALTATATPRVVSDVSKSLQIDPVVLRGSVDRPNLFYEVRRKHGNDEDVAAEIARCCRSEFDGQSGIVYVLSRKDAEMFAALLSRDHRVKAAPYHADLSPHKREATYRNWLCGRVHVVVATIAFGLGINKQDVRFVIHVCMASSMEGYYQESGRAGRDGQAARCIVFWNPADFMRLSSFAADKGPARLQMAYEGCRYAAGLALSAKKDSDSRDDAASFEQTGRGSTKRRRTLPGPAPRCRRAVIAAAFGESLPCRADADTEAQALNAGENNSLKSECCDVCFPRRAPNANTLSIRQPSSHIRDITAEACSAIRIVRHAQQERPDQKLTINMLVKEWTSHGAKAQKFRGLEPALPRGLEKDDVVEMIVAMILQGALSEFHVYGMYNMQAYLTDGDMSDAVLSGVLSVYVNDGSA